jgi:hypothetical protein
MLKNAYRPCLSLLVPLVLLAGLRAQQEDPAASQFVQEILSRSGSPSTVSLSFENMSSLSAADQDALKKNIINTFRASGTRLVKAEYAVAEIQITFSEDWQDYVWIAGIKQGPGNQVVIRKFARPPASSSSRAPILTIRKNLVWQQDGPILDFLSDSANLYVLEPEQVSVYGNDNGKWRLKQTLAVTHEQPWPRDLRGRLQLAAADSGLGQQISAFLPGTLCTGTAAPPAMQCRPSDDPWQVEPGVLAAFFSPARNFFTGVLAGQRFGESVPPFFSAAVLSIGDSRQWVFAGTDGRTRFYRNNLGTPITTSNDWGSSLAAIQSACGAGRQILVSSTNDLTHSDSVQAIEVGSREAVPVSSTIELSGPIKSMWPAENGQAVHAAVESLATGKYEAVSFTVACNQ